LVAEFLRILFADGRYRNSGWRAYLTNWVRRQQRARSGTRQSSDNRRQRPEFWRIHLQVARNAGEFRYKGSASGFVAEKSQKKTTFLSPDCGFGTVCFEDSHYDG
jgi:hypothetical protein